MAFVVSRASYRILESVHHRASGVGVPVLVCGSIPSAVATVRYLSSFQGDGVLRPVGLLADTIEETGRIAAGLQVLGTARDLVKTAIKTGAHGVVAAGHLADADWALIREACTSAGLVMYRLQHEATEEAAVHRQELRPEIAGQPASTEPNTTDGLRTLVVGVARCHKCRQWGLRRSRSRGALELIRRRLTSKRPYRCGSCGWRGWASHERLMEVWHGDDSENSRPEPDLASLDGPL